MKVRQTGGLPAVALASATLLLSVGIAVADGHVQYSTFCPSSGNPCTDECVITFQAPVDTPQARADVTFMKALFDGAMAGSTDMVAKVTDACAKPLASPRRQLTINVLRDDPKVFLGRARSDNPVNYTPNGIIDMDLGDIEDVINEVDASPTDKLTLANGWTVGLLAHEIDHARHETGQNHLDPPTFLGNGVTWAPVNDENLVMHQLNRGVRRNEYGYYDPATEEVLVSFTVNGNPVIYRGSNHKSVRSVQGKAVPHVTHVLSPSLAQSVPGHGCGDPGCYPLLGPVDADGDGVLDSVDNCLNVANPQQADNDGDGAGAGCDDNDDDDCCSATFEQATGSCDDTDFSVPEHWSCVPGNQICAPSVAPCIDGIDNDLDGKIDGEDRGCQMPLHSSFPQPTAPGQPYPDEHRQDLGGVPQGLDALYAVGQVELDFDLDGVPDSLVDVSGPIVLKHEGEGMSGGLTTFSGQILDLCLTGTDSTLGVFDIVVPFVPSCSISSQPGCPTFWQLTSFSPGQELPAGGVASFDLAMDSASFGPLVQVSSGQTTLTSASIFTWPPFFEDWSGFSGAVFSPPAGGGPVARILNMSMRAVNDPDFDTVQENDNCPINANPGQEDGDSDGTGDACDCDAADPTLQSTPSGLFLFFVDADTLIFSPKGPPGADVEWVDILRSDSPDDFLSATCVATDQPTFINVVTDTSKPGLGRAHYYQGQIENGCPEGEGPTGSGSDGTPHELGNCP